MRVAKLGLIAAALIALSCEDINKAKQDCLADPKCNAEFRVPVTEDGGGSADGGSDGGLDAGEERTLSLTVRGPGSVEVEGTICTSTNSPCQLSFPVNHVATLTAQPEDGGTTFHRWWRACSSSDQNEQCALPVPADVLITFWRYNYAFVTEGTQMPGALGSLASADAICQSAAVQAELPGRFIAILSTANEEIADRLSDAGAAGWVRTDGKLFALDRASMFMNGQNTIFYPLNLDEQGRPVEGHVPTGSNTIGRTSIDTHNCSDFTSLDAGNVTAGLIGGGGKFFIDDEFVDPRYAGAISCSDPVHLYCFGVDSSALPPRPQAPPDAGRIFLSAPVRGDYGVSNFDALCNQEADGGNFTAFVATTFQSARERVGGSMKFPLYRPDGVLVATEFATDGGLFQIAPDVDWTGQHTDRVYAWFGADDPFSKASPLDNCDDWRDGGGVGDSAVVRFPPPKNSEPAGQGNRPCDGPTQPVICVEH